MLPCLLTDTVSHDIDRAAHYALLWGLEGIELRSVGSAEARVPNVNIPKLERTLLESELEVAAVIPGLFENSVRRKVAWLNDLELLKEVVPFCERIGCKRIVITAFSSEKDRDVDCAELRKQAAEVFRAAAQVTSRRGVRIVILNESDTLCETAGHLADLISDVGHSHCRAGWSPAQSIGAGEDPLSACEGIVHHLDLVRFRDVQTVGAAWEDVTPGSGGVPWDRILGRLRRDGFDGPVTVEVQTKPRQREGLRASDFLHELLRRP